MYIGCLLIPLVILFFLAIALLRGLFSMGANILSIIGYRINNAINSFIDLLTSPFRAKPVESELDDPDYYQTTQEHPKRYSASDGEYVEYKKIR